MKKIPLILILALLVLNTYAQVADSIPKYFWVTFKDKADSPYQLNHPEVFLSEKALARRAKYNIPVTEADFPVNPTYLQSLREQGGLIHLSSRWLNAATVLAKPEVIDQIAKLPFVDTILYVGKYQKPRIEKRPRPFKDNLDTNLLVSNPYGYAHPQITAMKGDSLHSKGWNGQGITIAVLDGGFSNVDIIPFFDSLRQHNRFLGFHDFVDGDTNVFESSTHGTQVLSVMGANLPGLMVGTAPGANYLCIKTEDVRGEYLIEECNWVAGLEYADSIGADVVNSSLGYFVFNDASMNYKYEDLTGLKSMASRAVDYAFARGMIVVTSAGNEGNSAWRYISIPADAPNVLAVGSVFIDTTLRAGFSSVGPTADGRIKPDLVAPGVAITVVSQYSYKTRTSNGTSLSSPLIAGMTASLWSAFPNLNNEEIIDAIIKSCNQTVKPDNFLGHGLPDFLQAYKLLLKSQKEELQKR
ncbi:MAG: serine protease [Saprospiraceae bacterium]|nr:MAG: serine protease [Saprospiraceae bacterium]